MTAKQALTLQPNLANMLAMAGILCRLAQLAAASMLALIIAAAPVSGQLSHLLGAEQHVHCCCGEHAADEECGCPDCPAAVDKRSGERAKRAKQGDEAAQQTAMHKCGTGSDKPFSRTLIHRALVEPATAVPPLPALSIEVTPYASPPGSRVVPVPAAPS